MALRHQPLPLPQLLPAGAMGFAVLDLETTGPGQLCRIVDIALLDLPLGGDQAGVEHRDQPRRADPQCRCARSQ